MKARMALPDEPGLTEDQRRVRAAILATRRNLDGPFPAWLHSPELADLAQALGAFCRYRTGLPLLESELLILCVASHCRCVGEQQIHEPIARSAGLGDSVIAALRRGDQAELPTVRLQVLHDLARQLLTTHRIDDALFGAAQTEFGDRLLVEIVGIIGYYTLAAQTLNAFDMVKE
ncbi:MAG: carboxymuconolactone decarboxylase family protein [Steroidobacteraceae bacterium]